MNKLNKINNHFVINQLEDSQMNKRTTQLITSSIMYSIMLNIRAYHQIIWLIKILSCLQTFQGRLSEAISQWIGNLIRLSLWKRQVSCKMQVIFEVNQEEITIKEIKLTLYWINWSILGSWGNWVTLTRSYHLHCFSLMVQLIKHMHKDLISIKLFISKISINSPISMGIKT